MSEFISIKEVFTEQGFQEKLEEARRLKKVAWDSYSLEAWEKLKVDLDNKNFPEYLFSFQMRPETDNAFSSHKHEGDTHTLLSYVKNIRLDWNFDMEWRYVYCGSCGKVYHRIGTLMNKVERLAYTRWFTRSGKDVSGGEEEKIMENLSGKSSYDELSGPLV
jgi:hypothetical protein